MEEISKKEDFIAAYRIMEQSFPPCERRTFEKAFELLSRPGYRLLAVRKESGEIGGMIAAWEFDDFRYVEHFAVEKSIRGSGIGSQMMREYLSRSGIPVYLEVEADGTAVAERRIAFYRRLGFVLTQFGYWQPELQKTGEKVWLRLMGYPSGLTETRFQRLKKSLFSQVYGCSAL